MKTNIKKGIAVLLSLVMSFALMGTVAAYGNELYSDNTDTAREKFDGIPRDVFADGDVFTDASGITWTMIGSVPCSTRIENGVEVTVYDTRHIIEPFDIFDEDGEWFATVFPDPNVVNIVSTSSRVTSATRAPIQRNVNVNIASSSTWYDNMSWLGVHVEFTWDIAGSPSWPSFQLFTNAYARLTGLTQVLEILMGGGSTSTTGSQQLGLATNTKATFGVYSQTMYGFSSDITGTYTGDFY